MTKRWGNTAQETPRPGAAPDRGPCWPASGFLIHVHCVFLQLPWPSVSSSVKWGRWKESCTSGEMTGQWPAHRRCQVVVSLRPRPASVPGGRGLCSAPFRGAQGALRKPPPDAHGFEGTEDARKGTWEQCAPGRVPGGGCRRQAPR